MLKLKKNFNKVFIILTLVLSGVLLLINSSIFPKSEAGIFGCDGLGTGGIQPKSVETNMRNVIVLPKMGNRAYAIDEIFSINSSSYSIPYGHNDGDWFFRSGNDSIKEEITNLESDLDKRLRNHGNNLICVTSGFFPAITNTFQDFSYHTSSLIKNLSTSFLNSGFICSDPENPNNGCINLLKVIGGGKNEDGGIIGRLTTGFYFPLITISVIFLGIYIFFEGIIKRKYRESFQAMGWGLFIYVIGMVVLAMPWQISRLPQTVNSISLGCLVSAFNGDNCVDESSNNKDLISKINDSADIACSTASKNATSFNDSLQLNLSNLTCIIGKGFSIDRWSEQQFGYSFNALYTVKPTDRHTAPLYPSDKLVGSPEDYCVNMYSEYSPEELSKMDNPIFTDEKRICNIALAYMANRTRGEFGTKAKMEHIIATASKNDRMWNAFIGNGRDTFGFSAFISTLITAISFVPVAVFGHIYSLTATILMIFAPIFLLMAIHPGKGRKLFLGWLETVIGAILKTFATGFLLIVMILLFTSITSGMNGFMMLLVTIILTGTFILQRKELINMFGQVSLGGTKLSNKTGEMFEKIGNKAGHIGTSVAGGAIGGMIAGAKNGEGFSDTVAEMVKGMGSGASKGLATEMARGRGFVANAVRSGGKVSRDIKEKKKQFYDRQAEEKRRSDSLEALKTSAQMIADSNQAQYQSNLDNIKASNEAKETSIKTEATNAIYSQLGNTQSDVLRDKLEKEAETIKVLPVENGKIERFDTHTKKVLNDVSSIDNHLKQNPKDADLARSEYLNDFESHNFTELHKDIADMKEFLNKSGIEFDSKMIDDKFAEDELLKLLEVMTDMSDNFKLEKVGDRTNLVDFDMEKHLEQRIDYEEYKSKRKAEFLKTNFNIDYSESSPEEEETE